MHKCSAIGAWHRGLEGRKSSRGNLRKQEISLAVSKYFLQREPVLIDDIVGPRLSFERPMSALNGDAAYRACRLALNRVHDALAAEQVMTGGCHRIVNVLKADGAFQFFFKSFNVCLHIRMQFLFVLCFN
jgi:hypothetical protein